MKNIINEKLHTKSKYKSLYRKKKLMTNKNKTKNSGIKPSIILPTLKS